MKNQQYRHGDLLIEPIESLPKGLKDTDKTKERVLAYGEVTGHAHRLDNGVVKELEGVTYFSLVTTATLTHEEHGPIKFAPGNYRVTHQREYEPKRGSIRVID